MSLRTVAAVVVASLVLGFALGSFGIAGAGSDVSSPQTFAAPADCGSCSPDAMASGACADCPNAAAGASAGCPKEPSAMGAQGGCPSGSGEGDCGGNCP